MVPMVRLSDNLFFQILAIYFIFQNFTICFVYQLSSCLLYCFLLGLNKMVINQLEKLFVTSDAATVIKELEVLHRERG